MNRTLPNRVLPFLLLASVGCTPSDPSAPPADTAAPLPPGPPTEALGTPHTDPAGCSVVVHGIASGYGRVQAGAVPGTLLGLPGYGVHVRDADGTWAAVVGTAERPSPWAVLPSDDGTLWALEADDVRVLDPATDAWASTAFPGEPRDIVDGVASGTTLTLLVRSDVPGTDPYGPTTSLFTVHHHDGTGWAAGPSLAVGQVQLAALLPDDGLVYVDGGRLYVSEAGASPAEVPLPAGTEPLYVWTDDAGRALVLGSAPLWGPIDALLPIEGLPAGYTLMAVGADGPDLPWMAAATPAGELVVLHHDGGATVELALPVGLEGLSVWSFVAEGADRAWVGLRGDGREVLLEATPQGLTVDDDRQHPGRGDLLTIDDVDGVFHAIGPSASASWDGDRWVADDRGLPLTSLFGRGAVSGGRTLYDDHQALTVSDADGVTTTPFPDHTFHAHTGRDGVLFAVGADQPYEASASGPAAYVERGDGAGWQPLDTHLLPAGSALVAAWADGPDDLWLGVAHADGTGGLAHHDGVAIVEALDDLPRPPRWMARLDDGALWFSDADDAEDTDTLHRYEAGQASVVDAPPYVRGAWLDADGGLVVTARVDTEYQAAPGAPWQALQSDLPPPASDLVGHGPTLMGTLDLGAAFFVRTCP